MDPYLESSAHWPDFHFRFINYLSELAQPDLVPRGYFATICERLVLIDDYRAIIPDLAIKAGPESATPTIVPQATGVLTPVEIIVQPFQERQLYLEIQTATGEVITVIEVLSPTNKRPGNGRREYLKKQLRVLESQCNLVEIDLLRGGKHTVAAPLDSLAEKPRLSAASYLACVHRGGIPNRFLLYPIMLREQLPKIGIPLRAGEPDITLDLQSAMIKAYDGGVFQLRINYQGVLSGKFPFKDRAWIRELAASITT